MMFALSEAALVPVPLYQNYLKRDSKLLYSRKVLGSKQKISRKMKWLQHDAVFIPQT